MDKRWSLQGTTALVTGGASGIGFVFLLSSLYQNLASFLLLFNISLFVWGKYSRHAIVVELAGFGCRVHACDLSETLLNQSLCEWKKKGFQVSGSVCDVSCRSEREKLMQTVSTMFNGKLNILVSQI